MTADTFWTNLSSGLSINTVLSAFNGFVPILVTGVIVGLMIYLTKRVASKLGRGKAGY